MIKIQKNSAYAQVLEILNYIKLEDYYKVPKEIISALEINKDFESKFKYNKQKDFLDQDVSQEAKLLLAVFFKRYWATDAQKEKIRVYEINKVAEIEEQKKKIYPQNIMTEEMAKAKLEEQRKTQLAIIDSQKWYKKIIIKFRDLCRNTRLIVKEKYTMIKNSKFVDNVTKNLQAKMKGKTPAKEESLNNDVEVKDLENNIKSPEVVSENKTEDVKVESKKVTNSVN